MKLALACLSFVLLASCSNRTFEPAEILKYRLTVELLVEGEPISGSVVQELGFYEGPLKAPIAVSPITNGVRGNALVIQLREGGGILVPMFRGGARIPYEAMVYWACAGLGKDEDARGYLARIAPLLAPGCNVPVDSLPMFIWIPDLGSDDGLMRVRPGVPSENHGPEVQVVSVTISDAGTEPPTRGIERLIPWATEVRRLPARDTPRNQELFRKDFIKEKFL